MIPYSNNELAVVRNLVWPACSASSHHTAHSSKTMTVVISMQAVRSLLCWCGTDAVKEPQCLYLLHPCCTCQLSSISYKQSICVVRQQLTVYGPQVSHDFLLSHFLLQGLDAGGK